MKIVNFLSDGWVVECIKCLKKGLNKRVGKQNFKNWQEILVKGVGALKWGLLTPYEL